jgi:phosphatidylglycerol:prolipoprotein diacylglycerol transferase
MGFLAIPYPAIDPVALRIGPVAVKWYGLAYVAGLLLGRYYVKALLQQGRLWPSEKRPFAPDKVDDLLLFMTVGVLLGGRLGYVLFYQPQFFRPSSGMQPYGTAACRSRRAAGLDCAIFLFARRSARLAGA